MESQLPLGLDSEDVNRRGAVKYVGGEVFGQMTGEGANGLQGWITFGNRCLSVFLLRCLSRTRFSSHVNDSPL